MHESNAPVERRGGLRPRFDLDTPLPPARLGAAARQRLAASDCPVEGEVIDGHLRIGLPRERRRAWTPVLEARFEAEGAGSRLRCQYGPDPGAWTLFMALYLGSAFAGFTGLMFGWSQWSIGQSPTGFWGAGAAALGIGALHLVARRGQRAAAGQMDELEHCLTSFLAQVEVEGEGERGARPDGSAPGDVRGDAPERSDAP